MGALDVPFMIDHSPCRVLQTTEQDVVFVHSQLWLIDYFYLIAGVLFFLSGVAYCMWDISMWLLPGARVPSISIKDIKYSPHPVCQLLLCQMHFGHVRKQCSGRVEMLVFGRLLHAIHLSWSFAGKCGEFKRAVKACHICSLVAIVTAVWAWGKPICHMLPV